jgi:hypothetical protein
VGLLDHSVAMQGAAIGRVLIAARLTVMVCAQSKRVGGAHALASTKLKAAAPRAWRRRRDAQGLTVCALR